LLEAIFLSFVSKVFKVKVGVELDTCLGRQLGHSIFTIHLVTLFCHFVFVHHVIAQGLYVNTGRKKSVHQDISIPTDWRGEMSVLTHSETIMTDVSDVNC
jgi:hypothetical protein